MTPFYADEAVTLWHGDCREIVPALVADGLAVDCIVADPPYGETSLAWDKWPDDWPTIVSSAAKSMWCFGSMRMFLDRRDEFRFWRLSQDVVWEKQDRGTGLRSDRFRRVHELAAHWYRPPWGDIWQDVPRDGTKSRATSHVVRSKPTHQDPQWGGAFVHVDDGTRLMRSIIRADNLHGRASHPTQKPVGILDPLIRYACPPGGTVLDPFAGSGSTAEAARLTGRKAVLVEADERYCELIGRRMSQGVLPDVTA